MFRHWFHRMTVILAIRRYPMNKKYTLLVNNGVLSSQLEDEATAAFTNGRIVKVLDTPSGDDNATLVQVELTEEDYNTILEADRFANTHGTEPLISVTEYAPE
jgi:hypothetical protein